MSRKAWLLVLVLAGMPATGHAQVDMSAPPTDAPAAPDASPDAGAEQTRRDPVTTIFDNFSISLVAATKCGTKDEALMNRFVKNLMIVQQGTITHLRKSMPDKSVDEIVAMLNSRVENLDAVVSSAIQSKGCTDPEIVKLVETFTVNASLDFSKKP